MVQRGDYDNFCIGKYCICIANVQF